MVEEVTKFDRKRTKWLRYWPALFLVLLAVSFLIGRWLATRGLINALERGDPKAAKRCLVFFADPNALNRHEIPVLTRAAAEGFTDVALALIARGADVNKGGGQAGETALMYAAFWGHRKLAEGLIMAGAKVNGTNASGETALFDAIRGKDRDMPQFLVEQGADVAWENREGHTALWLSALRGNDHAAALLLQHINSFKARQLVDAFNIATARCHTNIVQLILSAKEASTNSAPHAGK